MKDALSDNEKKVADVTQSKNYFIRHWRGELSLAKSFWINFLIPLILPGLVSDIVHLTDIEITFTTNLSSTALMGLATIVMFIYVWQVVGLWRSAERWELQSYGKKSSLFGFERTGRGGAAKIVIALITICIGVAKPTVLILGLPNFLILVIGVLLLKLVLLFSK